MQPNYFYCVIAIFPKLPKFPLLLLYSHFLERK